MYRTLEPDSDTIILPSSIEMIVDNAAMREYHMKLLNTAKYIGDLYIDNRPQ